MDRRIRKGAIVSGVVGNALEWYDYALYASFAPLFASIFFSSAGSLYSIVKTFAIFAMGYIARPFGALIFGWIGDIKGRRVALLSSMMLMIFSTFLMGCIPSYDVGGLFSVWMLIFIRIFQGLAIGGEFSISSIYLVEHAPAGKHALFGSFAMVSLSLGITMGSVAFLIVYHIFGFEATFRWAWRLPFLLSGLFGVILFFIKRSISETHSFISTKSNKTALDLFKGLKSSRKNIFLGFVVAAGDSVPFYVFAIALRTILEVNFGYSATKSTLLGIIIVQSYGLSALLSGFLSDKTKEKTTLLYGCVAMVIVCLPSLFFLKSNGNSILKYPISCLIGLSLGLYHGSLPSFFVKMFPSATRSLSIALSYNAGVVFFGSTAPILFSFFVVRENGMLYLSYYIIGVIISAFLAIKFVVASNDV